MKETDLCKEILIKVLEESQIEIVGIDRIIEGRCYKVLERIKEIVQNPRFEDPECFERIEEIVIELDNIYTRFKRYILPLFAPRIVIFTSNTSSIAS